MPKTTESLIRLVALDGFQKVISVERPIPPTVHLPVVKVGEPLQSRVFLRVKKTRRYEEQPGPWIPRSKAR